MVNQKTKSLHSITIEGYQTRTVLQYNLNTNHITIGNSFTYTKQKYQNNKEIAKKYYQDNKDEIRLKQTKYEKINQEKISEYKKLYYILNKEQINKRNKKYQKINRDPNKIRKNSKDFRIMRSCISQGINIKDFNGFIGRHSNRDYVLPEEKCTKMNEKFKGSHFHHITKSIGIFIPSKLHNHIKHDIRKGANMGEINMLAIQFMMGDF